MGHGSATISCTAGASLLYSTSTDNRVSVAEVEARAPNKISGDAFMRAKINQTLADGANHVIGYKKSLFL